MKSAAESATRGMAGRSAAVPAFDALPERDGERVDTRDMGWPAHAGNEAVRRYVTTRAGVSLPPVARAILERHLGSRFHDVRIHTGDEAAALSRSLTARAFTVGKHVVLGEGEYAPATDRGLRLLAHELTHVVQQGPGASVPDGLDVVPPTHTSERAPAVAAQTLGSARPSIAAAGAATPGPADGALVGHVGTGTVPAGAIQRLPSGPVAQFDVDNEFTTRALIDYLDALDARGTIEDHSDSDDKSRAIVKLWVEGGSPFVVSARRAMLMIREMQDGFTGDDDERAILELLWRSSSNDLREIFGPGGIEVKDLNSDFHTIEWDWLRQFYDQRMPGASQRPPRIEPVGEPVALGTPIPVYARRPVRPERAQVDQDPQQTPGDLMHPERCATYEEWISFFSALPTYQSRLGHDVLGPAEAPPATATDLSADATLRRPPVREPRERYLPTDRFIDGPTETWVRANLPANLVATAYQLPSDCADIAVILRHVWLAAHNREEMYHGWLCGSRRGDPRTHDISALILNEVYSGNVAGIVSPYSDAAGGRLLTFGALEPLLHPGDVLVWSHPGGGGHTHTIMSIQRGARGEITDLVGLQGNQPIGERQAERMVAADRAAQARLPRAQRQGTPTEDSLRKAAGRRIEVGRVPFRLAQAHPDRVWDWGEGTRLVAAGPPAAAARPRPPRRQGRAITDWFAQIQAATLANLDSTFESALLELRTFLELGTPPTADQAASLGQLAGEQLRSLVRDAGDVQGSGTHLYRMQRMAGQVRYYARHVNRNNQPALWEGLERAFTDAARGISSVDFARAPLAGMRQVDVLVTGFDPFNTSDVSQPARPGDWNPSAAAARTLDGDTIPVNANVQAAVEGVVFPVSFREFSGGIVEKVLNAHPNVNAVITVSLDASLAPHGPVDLEQYAVGVHQLTRGGRERVPAAQGGGAGPIVEQATAPLGDVGQEAGQGGTAQDTLPQRPTVDFTLQLEFADATTADRALAALGLPPQRMDTVSIDDEGAARTVVSTMRREIGREGARITFAAGGHTFGAEVVGGPGGSFLSNEVSYRALRRLEERAAAGGGQGTSFHVHTPGGVQGTGQALPPEGNTPDGERQRADAEQNARTVLTRLVATLRRIIVSVARRIAAPRGAPRP